LKLLPNETNRLMWFLLLVHDYILTENDTIER